MAKFYLKNDGLMKVLFPLLNTSLSTVLFVSSLLLVNFDTHAELTADKIDQLTKTWLETERQGNYLKSNWQSEKPLLEQRIKLLKLEQKQLKKLLSNNQASSNEVEQKREDLLKQQANLETEQTLIANTIEQLKGRLDSLYSMLPPPLQTNWQVQESDNDSVVLEQQLSRLSRLKDFNERISLHSMRLTNEQGEQILVKQIYLGLSQAWFSSQNGTYSGYGLVENGTWNWHFNEQLDAQQILDAIAIVENQKSPSDINFDIKRLPVGAN